MALIIRAFALVFTSLAFVFAAHPAAALPSFGVQTDQPCSACHVGAFGPRLKQAGRDFKLYGYAATDTKQHGLPVSFLGEVSFTHTERDQIASQLAGYGDNDNLLFEGGSVFYGGRIVPNVGAFAEIVYETVEHKWHWEDVDFRFAHDGRLWGGDIVYGVTLNNAPSVQDLWESDPAWVFPFVGSSFTPSPAAGPLIDAVGGTLIGAGAYALWRDTLYVEFTGYGGLSKGLLGDVGAEPINGGDKIEGIAPYWRLTLQHEFDEGAHYLAGGAYGFVANIDPGAIPGGRRDHYEDVGFDLTYQWVPHPELSTSDVLSAHALYMHEHASLDASAPLLGGRSAHLDTVRADVTYAFDATFTPTLQYFRTTGNGPPGLWGVARSPDSRGWIGEIDFVPWGKPDDPRWYNARAALQYIAYSKFDGTSQHASDNNTLLFHLTFVLSTNGW